jgi:hypothetical protein
MTSVGLAGVYVCSSPVLVLHCKIMGGGTSRDGRFCLSGRGMDASLVRETYAVDWQSGTGSILPFLLL